MPTLPSLSWSCIYLSNFCHLQTNHWHFWLHLTSHFWKESEQQDLSKQVKSHLTYCIGWASLAITQQPLLAVLEQQQDALENLADQLLEQAHHHHLIGNVYKLLRKPDLAFEHLNIAIDLYQKIGIPFFIFHCKRTIASSYYYLNEFGLNYYDISVNMYSEAYDAVKEKDKATASSYYYDVGWSYSESGNYEAALDAFDKGYSIAKQAFLEIDLARHQWGMARIWYLLAEYQEAIMLLRKASLSFQLYHMPLMVSMCLQVEAACFQKMGDIDKALELAEKRALPIQRLVDDPVQLYHILRRIIILHCKKGDWYKNRIYFREYFKLKHRLKK